MREYVGVAFNTTICPTTDGKLSGRAEVIVLSSEMEYLPDGGGDITRRRDIDNFRFLIGARGLRALAAAFTEYADDLDKVEKQWRPVKAKPETPKSPPESAGP